MAITQQKVETWSNKKKVNKLLKALSSPSTEIRIFVIKALGSISDERALNTLIALLRDPDPSIRIAAAESLGNLANHRALEYMRHVSDNDSDKNVRKAAFNAFGKIKENIPQDE